MTGSCSTCGSPRADRAAVPHGSGILHPVTPARCSDPFHYSIVTPAEPVAQTPGSCPECGGGHTCHIGNGYSGHAASCPRNPMVRNP